MMHSQPDHLCRDGTSRQFGFVGFRSEDEANSALKYFNRTFMDTARITVEVCARPSSLLAMDQTWMR